MKKILLLAMMLLLAFFVTTACGSNGEEDTPVAEATPTPAPVETAEPSDDPAPEVPDDFDGLFYLAPLANPITLRLGASVGEAGPTVRAGITTDQGAHNQFIYDRIGVDLYYMWALPSAQAGERFNLALATGDIPDIMTLSHVSFFEMAEHGQLRCLRAAFDRYARPEIKEMFESLDNTPLDIATINGELLAIPHVLDPAQGLGQIWYRGDWADALDFTTPTTMDELEAMMQAFVDNEMGGPGTRGLGIYSNPVSWAPDVRAIMHGYGAYVGGSAGNWLLRDGELVNALIQPETQNALNRLRSWYASGIIHPEFVTMNIDQLQAELSAGRVGVISGEWWLGHWGGVVASMEYNPDVEWRVTNVVPAEGQLGYTIRGRANINNFRALSANAPEGAEEALIKMLNWFWEIFFVAEPFAYIEDDFVQTGEPGAFVWHWWPMLIWNAFEQQTNFDMVNAAIAAGNPDSLTSILQVDLFNSYQMLFNDAEFDDWWSHERAWGEWFTRVAPDGGWGTNVDIVRRGAFVESQFTGPPTETHLSRGSILHDMWLEFYAGYIIGNLPESEWDAFVAMWLATGGADWTVEINEQFARMQ
ncbi:MAG: hypothetical protein FWE11_07755 [Defluviitaleaceae bacterium]|nr:hypothetical protein [Defluviitaleaceae bacterium]